MKSYRQMSTATDVIARQRLQVMTDSEPADCSPEMMARMKKEIADVIARYSSLALDKYEIKVILRQKRERA